MSLQQQYPAEDAGEPDRFEGPFVGRGEHLRVFVDAIETQGPDDLSVLVYHGIGGIGKTRLARELAQMLDGESSKAEDLGLTPDPTPRSQFCWARIDFEVPERRRPARGLYHLRTQLSGKYGLHFPTFDLAFAEYWSKAYPEEPLPEPDPSFLDEHGDFALALLDAVGEVPVAGLLAKIPKHVNRLGEKAMDLYRKRNEEALQGLPSLPADEIEKRLPGLWTYDFNNQIDEAGRRAILFFDTYEALREGQRDETKRHQADRWVRELVKGLPGTLIVVTGHEQLYWPEVEEDWETVLRQQHLGELPPSDARRFLADSGIDEEEIRDHIVETASGVPSDLVLAFDLYQEMKRQNEEPTPEDFGETPLSLFERFFRYLGDDEMAMLELLAVPRSFTRDIAKTLAEEFDPGFPFGQFTRLKRFAFINQLGGDQEERRYSLHERARDAIREYARFFPEAERVHEFLFDYHAEPLEDLRPREIGPQHEQALREAFYHGHQFLDVEEFGEWFSKASEVFDQAARWQLLEVLQERLLSLQKKVFEKGHPQVATTQQNLAELYRKQGAYEESKSFYQQALKVRKSILGEEHPQVAETLNGLARLHRKRGEHEIAEPLHKRALEIRELALGEEHPQVAETLNTLGALYWKQGDFEEAKPLYQRALEIRESALGKEHPQVAETLNNLAALHKSQGRYERAESLHKRALEIRESALGDEHPRVAESLDNLGSVYWEQGEYEKAESLHEQGLEIRESALGEEHPRVALSLSNLAAVYSEDDQERYKETESLLNRALRIRRMTLGKDHFRVAETLHNLGSLHEEVGRYDESESLHEQALEIYESALGEEHPQVAQTINGLARLHRKRSEYEEAKVLRERALEIQESVLRKDHPDLAEALRNLAVLYLKHQEYDEAKPLLERAFAIFRQELGQMHSKTRQTAEALKALRAGEEK